MLVVPAFVRRVSVDPVDFFSEIVLQEVPLNIILHHLQLRNLVVLDHHVLDELLVLVLVLDVALVPLPVYVYFLRFQVAAKSLVVERRLFRQVRPPRLVQTRISGQR